MTAINSLGAHLGPVPCREPDSNRNRTTHGRDMPQDLFGSVNDQSLSIKLSLIRGGAAHPTRTSRHLPRLWHGGNC
jgi:hypothetical protein